MTAPARIRLDARTKAVAALDVADRKLARATARADKLTAELRVAITERDALIAERAYLAGSPYLRPVSNEADDRLTVGQTAEEAAAATAIPAGPAPHLGDGA